MHVALGHGALGGLGDFDQRHAFDLALAVAQHVLQGWVGDEHAPLAIGHGNAHGGVVVKALPAPLGHLQRVQALLQKLAVRDQFGGQFAHV